MNKYYNNILKKSIYSALFGFYLFFALPTLAITPNDPNYSEQIRMYRQIGVDKAWDKVVKTNAVVAIIDIGVDYTHPDLLDNIWVNSAEIPGNNIDDDKNGFIDDVYGWNFVENNPYPKPILDGAYDDYDTLSHGTGIAGLIGAVGNNLKNGTGINWQVKIMPIRAINNNGLGRYENVVKAINYAVDNGADIINISFIGDYFDHNIYNALKNAYSKGVLTVVAAGNDRQSGYGNLDSHPIYPICFDKNSEENWLLGVASVNPNDQLSYFSNYGTCIDITAPGEIIYTTEIPSPRNGFTGFGGSWQGTSYSAPLVAGAAALLKGLRPDWAARELVDILLKSADDIDYLNSGMNGLMGYGRLNVGRAVEMIQVWQAKTDIGIVCYSNQSRLYCYDTNTQANRFLTQAGGIIKAFDWYERKYVSTIIAGTGVDRVEIYKNDGLKLNSIKLDGYYNQIVSKEIANTYISFVAQYSSVNNQTKFLSYDLFGVRKSEFSIVGNWLNYDFDQDNIYTVSIINGRLTSRIYNWSGKLLTEIKDGPRAANISAVKVGNLWSSDKDLAILAEDQKGYFLFVLDFSSRSSFIHRLSGNTNKMLIVSDRNNDGLSDLFFYNINGGKFNIYTAKGILLDVVIDLPDFK